MSLKISTGFSLNKFKYFNCSGVTSLGFDITRFSIFSKPFTISKIYWSPKYSGSSSKALLIFLLLSISIPIAFAKRTDSFMLSSPLLINSFTIAESFKLDTLFFDLLINFVEPELLTPADHLLIVLSIANEDSFT